MIIINNFFIGFLYLLVFTLVYFSLEKIISWKKVISLGVPAEATNFIFGILIGVVAMLGNYFFSRSTTPNHISVVIISISILIHFKSWQIATYSLIPSITYKVVAVDTTKELYFEVIALFAIILIIEVSRYFVNQKRLWIPLIGTLLLLMFISLPTVYLYFNNGSIISLIEKTTLSFLWSIIYFGLFFYFIRFSISSKLLFESSNFSFLNYYRTGLANAAIIDFINRNKIEYGVLALFKIEYRDNNFTEQQKTEIRETVLYKIAESIKGLSIQFTAPENRYGFFVGVNSSSVNTDKILRNVFSKIPSYYKTSWNKIVGVDITSGASVYGLHDSSIAPLMEYSTFTLNTIGSESIKVFNPLEYRKSSSDQRELSLLDKNITLDDYANKYIELWKIGDSIEPFGIRSEVNNVSEFSWIEPVDEQVYFKNWHRIFTRYFSNEALSQVKDLPLLIDYDLSILDETFVIKDFIYQVKKLKIKPNNIYLVIKDIAWEKVTAYKTIRDNVETLTSHGINFVIDNNTISKNVRRVFKTVEYVFVDAENINEKKYTSATYIAFNITSLAELAFIYNEGVDILGGPLIKSEFTFKNFDKQSKIYLEDILRKRRDHDK